MKKEKKKKEEEKEIGNCCLHGWTKWRKEVRNAVREREREVKFSESYRLSLKSYNAIAVCCVNIVFDVFHSACDWRCFRAALVHRSCCPGHGERTECRRSLSAVSWHIVEGHNEQENAHAENVGEHG